VSVLEEVVVVEVSRNRNGNSVHRIEMELSVYDYIVFVAVLLTSAGIGVYYRFTGGKQKTIQVGLS
jgi:hypothetical protein